MTSLPISEETTFQDDNIIPQDVTDSSISVIVELRRPKGAFLLTQLECFILFGKIGVNIVTMSLHLPTLTGHEYLMEISSLTAWIYIATLAWLRLVFMFSRPFPLPKLWSHTASLYCMQWMLTLLRFCFGQVSPLSSYLGILQVAEFVLSSVLALIAVTTTDPQGVVITHQADLSPSAEPFASILSLATFSWVNTIVWRGNRKDFSLNDVWDLRRRDQVNQLLQRYRRSSRSTRLLWRLFSHFKSKLALQMSWSFLGALLTFAPTLLLKAILQYMEDPESSSLSTAWLYVSLLAVSGCMYGIADGQAAWTGRKNGMQMESILIGGNLNTTVPSGQFSC
jgi:hypothetical protein